MLQGFLYVRHNNPSRQILENGFALLEDAKYSLCFSSGTSAISAIVQLLNTGDHIVSSEIIFGGTYRYFDKVRLQFFALLVNTRICIIRLESALFCLSSTVWLVC